MDSANTQQLISIVGGGPVGLITSLALSSSGIKSTIIDRADLVSQQDEEFDGRVLSLNYGSKLFLESLGLWDELCSFATPIKDIYVSDSGSSAHLHYNHRLIGSDPMGYMIEIRHLRRILLNAVMKNDLIDLVDKTEISSIEKRMFHWEINSSIKSNLLVAADGRFSYIRKLANIGTIEKDYYQTALVFTVEHDLSHDNYAFEHFMPEGPLAFLPMDNNMSAVVWTMGHDRARRVKDLPADDLCMLLRKSFGGALGDFRLVTKVWSYRLSIVMAKKMFGDRVVLVGDSAHGIHPVAGQGLNLGIKDIIDFVDIIKSNMDLGLDVGSRTVLRGYDLRRRLDVLSIAGSSHGIIRLFSNDIFPIKVARSVGLRLVNSLPIAKRFFMKKAMGL